MASVGKGGPSLSVGRGIGAALMVTSILLLASCNSATVNPGGPIANPDADVTDKVRSLDILPRFPTQAGTSTTSSGPRAQPAVFEGTEITDVAAPRAQPTAGGSGGGNGFDLNFDSAPVATVAKVVLGDILQTGYTIDPRVQGTVSLVSVRPVPKSDIIFVLENALRISGVVLVRDTSGYRLSPVGDAVGAGRVDTAASNPDPGYGVSVVPLQYVSAQTLLKLMDSFATKPGVVRADTTRNLLLIQGTGPERRTAVETALSFDVDWMRGQSIGVYPITNSNPEPIITELEKVLDSGENGLNQNMVKLQPVARLNAVMVVAKKPGLLHTVETWIRRLDRADSTRTSVHVYKVKYGDAKQMARVLNDMFGGGSSSSLLDSADNQVAPGSGTASVSDRSSFGTNTNTGSGIGGGSTSASQGGSSFGSRNNSSFGSSSGFGGTSNVASGGNPGQLDKGSGPGSSGPPLLQNVRITPDVVNNSLLIYADQSNYRIIESTVKQLDQPQLQVAIDATIAEVTLTDELSYGVQFFLTSKALGLRPDQGSLLNTQSTAAPTTATTTATGTAAAAGTVANAFINRAFPGFNFLVGQEANPAMILDALHSVTAVKVLSNPSLVVVNNQSATLQVGNQVPISTGSANVLNSATATSNTIVNTVDYRNTGVILHVAPRVSANGNVRLEVEQEISQVVPSTNPNTSLTPTISERKVKSSISVANGQTVLLAGLIQDQKNENRNGIPWLDELKGVGDAFSHQDNTKTRTELIIFIRPQIIRDAVDAHTVAEELRSKLRGTVSASTPNETRIQTIYNNTH